MNTKAKIDALDIIFSCPLWPCKSELPDSAISLYESIIDQAKDYSIAIAEGRTKDSLKTASIWSILCNELLDNQHISDNEGCLKLIKVYKHYADSIGIDFNEIGVVMGCKKKSGGGKKK